MKEETVNWLLEKSYMDYWGEFLEQHQALEQYEDYAIAHNIMRVFLKDYLSK